MCQGRDSLASDAGKHCQQCYWISLEPPARCSKGALLGYARLQAVCGMNGDREMEVGKVFQPVLSASFNHMREYHPWSATYCRVIRATSLVVTLNKNPRRTNASMAAITNLPEAVNMTKDASFDSEALHLEKPIDNDDIVARMNNLDPPVTPEEERRVRRKIDLRLPPFLLVLYMFTWLDRGALGNAVLMDIKEDLSFSGPQFSLAVSMFFVGTCVADLFTNIGMRYIRPSRYLAAAMVIWGIFASLQAVAGGPNGMYAIRFFLGIFEAAFISGAPYLTTVLYPRAVGYHSAGIVCD